MASVTISSNPSTTSNTLVVDFTTDIANIDSIELTKDGSNFIQATSFTSTSATFNVSSWENGTYANCYLRVTYTKPSSTQAIVLNTIGDITVSKGEAFDITYSTNIPATKHEISWDGGSTFWDKTSEIIVNDSVNYRYSHDPVTDYSGFNMAIRVTDANNNTSTKTFLITVNANSDPSTVYDSPTFTVQDFKVILSQDGYTETFDANYGISPFYFSNEKEVVGADGNSYYIALVPDDNGSRFRVNGLYPDSGGCREALDKNGNPYVLLDYPFPTYNDWSFSCYVKNTNDSVEAELLSTALYNVNTALPALNITTSTSTINTIVKDSYQETWYGLTMGYSDHFEIKMNSQSCDTDFGAYGSSTSANNKWVGTVLHEFGHTLGFMDNAEHAPTVYNYARNRNKCVYFQAPDIYTLKYLYKEKYGIDISKPQSQITSQAISLGLLSSQDTASYQSKRIEEPQFNFDYGQFEEVELEDKADVIVKGKLVLNGVEEINISKSETPYVLKYNVFDITPHEVLKGELTNKQVKIHVSENLNIKEDALYKIYLKQYDNVPCSLINMEQGIQKL